MPVVPALGSLRQQDHLSSVGASLDYIVRSCLNKKKVNLHFETSSMGEDSGKKEDRILPNGGGEDRKRVEVLKTTLLC